ncbi:site-specific integrase, partial [Streptomyces solisilvae]
MTRLLITPAQPALATHRGAAATEVLRAFPPRTLATSWPQTEAPREEVLNRLHQPPLRYENKQSQYQRTVGASLLLDWLTTLPGNTWQQRWDTSLASADYNGWYQEAWVWAAAQGRPLSRNWSDNGLLALICADVVRPSMQWLVGNGGRHFRPAVATTRDPDGFARLAADVPAQERATAIAKMAMKYIAQIVVAYGGSVDDISVGDLLAHPRVHGHGSQAVRLAYNWLRNRGQFPTDAPATLQNLTARTGQISPSGLIDRYQLRCQPVRDLLVDYLTERQPTVDYTTLNSIASHLGGLFWADLEHHHPGINTLRLPSDVSDAWKARVAVKTVRRRLADGTIKTVTQPRQSVVGVKQTVRAFYLDLAHWALEEPARWGGWAAPCPIDEAECVTKKRDQQQKSRSDQRTRERMPVLPVLVRTAERRLKEARARLDAIDAAPLGSTVTIQGETFTLPRSSQRADGKSEEVHDASGVRRHPRREEKRAFFAWATIEILRHTGIRVEELLELRACLTWSAWRASCSRSGLPRVRGRRGSGSL